MRSMSLNMVKAKITVELGEGSAFSLFLNGGFVKGLVLVGVDVHLDPIGFFVLEKGFFVEAEIFLRGFEQALLLLYSHVVGFENVAHVVLNHNVAVSSNVEGLISSVSDGRLQQLRIQP